MVLKTPPRQMPKTFRCQAPQRGAPRPPEIVGAPARRMTPAPAPPNMAEFRHGAGEGHAMTNTETLAARINVLSLGLQGIARAVAPA